MVGVLLGATLGSPEGLRLGDTEEFIDGMSEGVVVGSELGANETDGIADVVGLPEGCIERLGARLEVGDLEGSRLG